MARINPYTLDRPKRKAPVKRVFSDPAQPGVEFELELQANTPVEAGNAYERGMRLYKILSGEDDEGDPIPLPPVLEGTEISETTILSAALLGAMQRQAEPYDILELVAIAETMPEAWRKMTAFSAQVQKGDLKPGNAGSGPDTTD